MSRLVIIDVILPETNVAEFTAFMDISMMALGGKERTESQWRGLLRGAGFEILNIRRPENAVRSPDSVIEAVLG